MLTYIVICITQPSRVVPTLCMSPRSEPALGVRGQRKRRGFESAASCMTCLGKLQPVRATPDWGVTLHRSACGCLAVTLAINGLVEHLHLRCSQYAVVAQHSRQLVIESRSGRCQSSTACEHQYPFLGAQAGSLPRNLISTPNAQRIQPDSSLEWSHNTCRPCRAGEHCGLRSSI